MRPWRPTQWALKHGDRYRIAYCCHADDFEVPDGWDAMTRGFKGRRTGASRDGRHGDVQPGVRAAASEALVTGYNRDAWTDFVMGAEPVIARWATSSRR